MNGWNPTRKYKRMAGSRQTGRADHLGTLVLDDVRLDRRQLRHLVTLHLSHGLDLLELLRQRLTTVLAFHRQHRSHFLNLLYRSHGAVMAGMALLSTRFALALFSPPALSRTPRQPIGGWWFGRVGGILLARCQLPLQIGDLLFGVGDILFAPGYLLIPFRYLLLQPLNLPLLLLHL